MANKPSKDSKKFTPVLRKSDCCRRDEAEDSLKGQAKEIARLSKALSAASADAEAARELTWKLEAQTATLESDLAASRKHAALLQVS